jgi:hypothetical protein
VARIAAAAMIAGFAVTSLAACTQPSPKPTHTTASPTATATGSATPAPDPTFAPKGSAADNRAFFDFVNDRTVAANPQPVGRTFIDALVAAGFAKADMQVTADKTSINLTPGSIQFSVRMGKECLVGQFGSTVPINW